MQQKETWLGKTKPEKLSKTTTALQLATILDLQLQF